MDPSPLDSMMDRMSLTSENPLCTNNCTRSCTYGIESVNGVAINPSYAAGPSGYDLGPDCILGHRDMYDRPVSCPRCDKYAFGAVTTATEFNVLSDIHDYNRKIAMVDSGVWTYQRDDTDICGNIVVNDIVLTDGTTVYAGSILQLEDIYDPEYEIRYYCFYDKEQSVRGIWKQISGIYVLGAQIVY